MFIGTRHAVHPLHLTRQLASLAEYSQHAAIQIHLVDAPDTPDKDHLMGAWRDAQRPRRPDVVPLLQKLSVRVEHLNATGAAIGNVQISFGVDDDRVWRV